MARVRIFHIVQYEKNPVTGDDLDFDEVNIIQGTSHKSIKRYAYIRHDKDVFLKEDFRKYVIAHGEEPAWEIGDVRPAHWHIVGQCDTAIELSSLARWFGVPQNMIDIPRGRDAFLDSVEYLTHEREEQQELGKYHYADEEVHSNFPWRKEINERQEKRLKFGHDVSQKDIYRYQVLYEGMTIRQLVEVDPIAYQNDYSTLDKFRLKYITERAKVPQTRLNYYVCGEGGIGKGLICKALARSFYPDIQDDEDIFFETGAKGAAFEGYDGQPVIIWHDRRAIDLLKELGGRGNVFNVFDTHPTRMKQNVKFSSVCLCNEVNIVNSVQPYAEFLDGLAGTYKTKGGAVELEEDKSQSYRRFPFIIPLHEQDFDLLMNKGFYYGTREYEQYEEYKNIKGNMQRIAEQCGANEALAKELQTKAVKPVTDKHHEVLEKFERQERSEDEIRQMFADVGTMPIQPPEQPQTNGTLADVQIPGQMSIEDLKR